VNQRNRTRTESTVWVRTGCIKIISLEHSGFITSAEENNEKVWPFAEVLLCGQFVDCLWTICGQFVDSLWTVFGQFVDSFWTVCGCLKEISAII
jgi:hypothetical protein